MYTHPFIDGALLQISRLHRTLLLLIGVQLGGCTLLRSACQRIGLRPRLVWQSARLDSDKLRKRPVHTDATIVMPHPAKLVLVPCLPCKCMDALQKQASVDTGSPTKTPAWCMTCVPLGILRPRLQIAHQC